jgi:hypothetical protein
MKRTVNTKFYTFRQNNSGGYDIINDDVAKYLIIEATSATEAINSMYQVTKNYSEYCSCCGERWSSYLDDEDGTDDPMVYDRKVKEIEPEYGGSVIIYYFDGSKEKLWYE